MIIPNLTIRSFTNDQFYLDKAFYSNHYRLKGFKGGNGPVVMDVGSHCGFFTFASLSLGAKRVHAFEPFLENYKIFLKNTSSAEMGSVISHQLGISYEDRVLSLSYPKLLEGAYYDCANLEVDSNTGPRFVSYCISLKKAIEELVLEKIDILKIGMDYSIFDIIFSYPEIHNRVNNIVFETSEPPDDIQYFIKEMNNRGFHESAVSPVEDENKQLVIISVDKIANNFIIK